jgi:DNA (cytosine-5)-methyltransferase 1
MRHGSLFSGIGGFDLAAEWMGWENVFHCEWNPFGQKVLKHYWPHSISYNDITKTDFTVHRGTIDIITGGFPCQPYSAAGKRLGKDDERHLWPEMLRAIREVSPSWIVGENVRGLTNWNGGMVFDEVQADLEAIGYEVTPFLLPACAVNAPHRRDRIWFIAYSNKISGQSMGICKNENIQQREKKKWSINRNEFYMVFNGNTFEIRQRGGQEIICEPPLISEINGISTQLDGITFPKWTNESNGAYGNAVVPQVVYQIFKAIEQYGKQNTSKDQSQI